ncbi:MAG: hypothetical protein KAH01_00395 [Caldisericia bacterium]|nr:hypothetical protein [Caldisericia bacterium]
MKKQSKNLIVTVCSLIVLFVLVFLFVYRKDNTSSSAPIVDEHQKQYQQQKDPNEDDCLGKLLKTIINECNILYNENEKSLDLSNGFVIYWMDGTSLQFRTEMNAIERNFNDLSEFSKRLKESYNVEFLVLIDPMGRDYDTSELYVDYLDSSIDENAAEYYNNLPFNIYFDRNNCFQKKHSFLNMASFVMFFDRNQELLYNKNFFTPDISEGLDEISKFIAENKIR